MDIDLDVELTHSLERRANKHLGNTIMIKVWAGRERETKPSIRFRRGRVIQSESSLFHYTAACERIRHMAIRIALQTSNSPEHSVKLL